MLKNRSKGFPPGSVKDCARYDGPLQDWVGNEEEYLQQIARDFGLYGFDHESMLVPAIFPMVDLVQRNWIHGQDFFSGGIFVEYDEPREFLTDEKASHHSGWRLLKDADKPGGIVHPK